mmetsp:Transcript_56346/g.183012  ORF Transcript_56346/g.183012 Transcript_56346/m.183012 type:complete len:222 (+) Transcript_56346:946-1611(+)
MYMQDPMLFALLGKGCQRSQSSRAVHVAKIGSAARRRVWHHNPDAQRARSVRTRRIVSRPRSARIAARSPASWWRPRRASGRRAGGRGGHPLRPSRAAPAAPHASGQQPRAAATLAARSPALATARVARPHTKARAQHPLAGPPPRQLGVLAAAARTPPSRSAAPPAGGVPQAGSPRRRGRSSSRSSRPRATRPRAKARRSRVDELGERRRRSSPRTVPKL